MIKKLKNIFSGRRDDAGIVAKLSAAEGNDETSKRLARLGTADRAFVSAPRDEYDDFIWDVSGDLADDPDIQSLVSQYQTEIRATEGTSFLGIKLPSSGFDSWLKPATGVVGAVALLLLVLYLPTAGTETSYETPIGGQRVVELADASLITLNTNTHVRVSYSDGARNVYLDRGEAIFTVEKDKQRPFNVYVGDKLVRAVGTEFNIYLERGQQELVTVSVLEGIVTILDARNSEAASSLPLLVRGEEAILGDNLIPSKHQADLTRITGWRDGQIVFHDISLDKAVKDHNRYAQRKIVLADPSLADERISGTFKVGDSEALLFALENLLGLEIRRTDESVLISKQHS
ncbi:FecR family protein [Kordiimonas sp.]|uniref:FecR family protein n=1 Tax=Kordiimonas sp. TaxID=1970157 RepID=UPI003A93C181